MPTTKSGSPDRVTPVLWLSLAAIAVLLVLIWRGTRRTEAAPHPAVGHSLAVVHLEPLTGDAKAISTDDLLGKVTLINFWGPWCEFCGDEMPHLVRLREKFAKRYDVQFVFVSCSLEWRQNTPPAIGWSENLPQLKSDTSELLGVWKYDIPTWSDPRGKTRQAFAGLDEWEGYPTTLLVDRAGVIRYVAIGYFSGDEHGIEDALQDLVVNEKK